MISKYMRECIAAALRQPGGNLFGVIMLKVMERKNRYLERAAVRLSKIEPHHNVLEIGFGPGVGLEIACNTVKEGTGKVYGIDHSAYAVSKVSNLLSHYIKSNKLEVHTANVVDLPFFNNTFDRVFHCNCFYFWPEFLGAAKEIHRVMKHNGLMVTTLNLEALQHAKSQGIMKNADIDVLNYMVALESAKFKNVYIEYLKYRDMPYQAIYAEADKGR